MTKNKKIIIWCSFIALFLLLLTLGTIYDLEISKAIARPTPNEYLSYNAFAMIGEIFGENVLYILLVCAFNIVFFKVLKSPFARKWVNHCLLIFSILAGLVITMYCIGNTLNSIFEYTKTDIESIISTTIWLISLFAISCIILFLVSLLFNKMSVTNLNNLFTWAILVIIVCAVSNLSVQIIKHIFDRTRYRAMIYVNDTNFYYYSPWYEINAQKFTSVSGFAEDFFKSLPSGHTCAASSLFTITTLPLFINKLNNTKSKTILWLCASFYIFLVAFSRIVAGAHFFTDVFIAMVITLVCTIITTFIFSKLKLIRNNSK